MPEATRAVELQARLESLGLPADSLGPTDLAARLGPDHAGRYEVLFSHLQAALGKVSSELIQSLMLTDASERIRSVDPSTALEKRSNRAFDDVMALKNLVCLFGQQATQNSFETLRKAFRPANPRRDRNSLPPAAIRISGNCCWADFPTQPCIRG